MDTKEYLYKAKYEFIALLDYMKKENIITDYKINSWLEKHKNNPEYIESTVKKYGDRMDYHEWCNIKIYGVNDYNKFSTLRNDKYRELNVCFDTGAGCGAIDWEMDWSFHTSKSTKELENVSEGIQIVDYFAQKQSFEKEINNE